jgi:hypothetical protein
MAKVSRRVFTTYASSAAAGLVGGAVILTGYGKDGGSAPAEKHNCKGMNEERSSLESAKGGPTRGLQMANSTLETRSLS